MKPSTYILDIQNFQSIENQTLTFNSFCCIVGRSDIGKSATRRALQSVLFNEWDKSFIRTNSKEAKISFKVKRDDNSIPLSISTTKSSTKNEFSINNTHINKMGKDKPTLPLKISTELNFNTQFEPLFMVAYKDTENTRLLNSLFGIDVLELAQSLAQKDLRDIKSQVNQLKDKLTKERQDYDNTKSLFDHTTQELKETKELIDEISLIDNYSKMLYNRSKIENRYNSLIGDENALKSILTQMTAIFDYLSYSKEKNSIQERLDFINKELEKFSTLNGMTKLNNYIDNIKLRDTTTQRLQQVIDNIAEIDKELATHKCPTCGEYTI